jgi:hypothetical protein
MFDLLSGRYATGLKMMMMMMMMMMSIPVKDDS